MFDKPFADLPEYTWWLIVIELDRFVSVVLVRVAAPLKVVQCFNVIVLLSMPSTVVASTVPVVEFELIGAVGVYSPVYIQSSFIDPQLIA